MESRGKIMAQRRMFSLKIIDTDRFLEMPSSSRLLYFDLSMRADDDGFVDAPKKILNMTGASEDDLKILCAKQYLIPFDSGVCVIKDWKIHNYIAKDRYTETHYKDEKTMLIIDENESYTKCIQDGNKMLTQVRLGKDREGKESTGKERKTFTPPTIEEIKQHLLENNITSFTSEQFFNFYESKGWMIGKNKMKSWKAAVQTWEAKAESKSKATVSPDGMKRLPNGKLDMNDDATRKAYLERAYKAR
jgi:hypothetical protein